MMNPIRIALVDDQKLFRQSLSSLISEEEGLEIVAEYDSGRMFLQYLEESGRIPDLVILDMEMPEINGMEVNALLQKQYPGIKVIALSIHTDQRLIAKIIEHGASGYLVKTCDREELFSAIRTVYQAGFYINSHVLQAIQRSAASRNKPVKSLAGIAIVISEREKEILRLICKEMTAPEIAAQLFISIRTVEGHRNKLLAKTGCRNIAGLALFAIKNGIFELLP